eukprot:14396745-Alexandrium_andersonii.AAC.1
MTPHREAKTEEASQASPGKNKEDLGEKSRPPRGSASAQAQAAQEAATHAAAYGPELDDADDAAIVPEQQGQAEWI